MDTYEEAFEKRRSEIVEECKKRKIDFTSSGLDDLDAFNIALCLMEGSG